MSTAADEPRPQPRPKATLCAYCGSLSRDSARCEQCKGLLDPLSRQATQNAMGPWRLRDERSPFNPGFSFETLLQMVAKGKITPSSVIAGPSTRQFWALASRTPGVANLFGRCHNCRGEVPRDARACPACRASFEVSTDRQHLGLGAVHLVPGQSPPEAIAAAALNPSASRSNARAPRPGPLPREAGVPGTVPAGAAGPRPPSPVEVSLRAGLRARGLMVGLLALALFITAMALAAVVLAPLVGYSLTFPAVARQEPGDPPPPGPVPEASPDQPDAADEPDPPPTETEPLNPDDPFEDLREGLLSTSLPVLDAAITALEARLAGGTLSERDQGEARSLLAAARTRRAHLRARELP